MVFFMAFQQSIELQFPFRWCNFCIGRWCRILQLHLFIIRYLYIAQIWELLSWLSAFKGYTLDLQPSTDIYSLLIILMINYMWVWRSNGIAAMWSAALFLWFILANTTIHRLRNRDYYIKFIELRHYE